VFGDDRVMCYTGVGDVVGGIGETYIRRGASLGKTFMMFSCFMVFLNIL